MKNILKVLIPLFGFIFLVACGGGSEPVSENESSSGADDKTYTVRVAHSSAATNDRLENSLQEFKKAVEEKSEGRLIIETYPNSQLGGERETLEGVQMGTIEMAVLSTAPFGGFFEKMMILDLPYIFKNEEVADKVLDGPFGDKLFSLMLEETGLRGLAWGENGIRHMANNIRPIESPADIEGLKIRTQENQAHMDMIKAFGGSPTPLAFPELYSSLQQGVIDGYENPISLITGMRFYEVTKYITLNSHVYGAYAFITNDDFFQTLPEDLQNIIVEESKNWSKIEREFNRKQTEEGIDLVKEQGVEVIELSDEQIAEFQELAMPVVESYRSQIGEELFDELMAAIAEAEAN
ncbi:TRAP transporter substrate-binding protein [Bacillus sp. Marseille-P3661]|uniref:TRAP transporter substrate-binding protein n=1 Tax=Bacillus sp. Marseille-P3661 TaxID=1936234 RepID=UPI000C8290F8|nr:DctP family TRAP transporter solute-binding subunit [Bacillus sp. Marseille-P3661]